MSRDGELKYRVQLPPEGSIVFLGWEKNGRVLAAVQKLGGAFLWFPSKPQTMQQWEGMQFSSKILKNSVSVQHKFLSVDNSNPKDPQELGR